MQLTDAPDMVALNVLSIYIESCVWSISQSDVITVEQAIQLFSISMETISLCSVEITWILNEVFTIACPGEPMMCSGHGSCVAGLCVCNTGINSLVTSFIVFLSQSLCFVCRFKQCSIMLLLNILSCKQKNSLALHCLQL